MKQFVLITTLSAILCSGTAMSAQIEFVEVRNAGNPSDPISHSNYGTVDYEYRIGKYEVMNAQYAEMLNAVAASDSHGLYNTNMASYGITRSGLSGNYVYSVNVDWGNKPVNYIS